MKNEKKVVLFMHDGVLEGAFTSDPEIHVTVSIFETDLDSKEAENEFWSQCEQKGLKQFTPCIYHPNNEEEE